MKDYKKILEGVVNIIETSENGDAVANICDYIRENCPEFQENEDEKIRKVLVEFFKSYKEQGTCGAETFNGISTDNILAWLEKQSEVKPYGGVSFKYNDHIWGMCRRDGGVEILMDSELKAFVSLDKSFIYPTHPQPIIVQKSAPEVIKEEKVDSQNCVKPTPKFHKDDWITDGYLHCKISDVLNDRYIVDTKFPKRSAIPFKRENNYHFWTVQDAKDGDVLAESKGDVILMFRRIGNTEWDDVIDYHCYYDCSRKVFIVQEDVEYWDNTENNQLKPATKEQRDTLMKAMTDAGYTFDFDKKELKKIEQNPAWSEDDEGYYNSIIEHLKYSIAYGKPETYKGGRLTDWLKSIKERVQPQPKQELSKEDENAIDVIKNVIKDSDKINSQIYTDDVKDVLLKWLKSLKDRDDCEVNCTTAKEWSEEDAEKLTLKKIEDNDIERKKEALLYKKRMDIQIGVCCPNLMKDNYIQAYREGIDAAIEHILHLRPQITWKPSDEQMGCLCEALNKSTGAIYDGLKSLFDELQNLK